MAEKKESYSEEELNEMIVWFNNHADELPKEMQINKAAFTPNLKLTVESCIMQAKQCLGNYIKACLLIVDVWATIRWPELSGCSNKSERTLKTINDIFNYLISKSGCFFIEKI